MRAVTDFFLKNYTFTAALTILILVTCYISYNSLPVEQNPDVTIPIVLVMTVYPGTSPEDIERDVTEKLEEYISELTDMDYYQSVSSEGVSTVIVVYDAGYDIDKALRDVRDKVDLARTQLPDDAEEPVVNDLTTSDIPTLILSVAANRPDDQMSEIADTIADEIESLPLVNRVDIFGNRKREIHIELLPDRMEHFSIGINELTNAVSLENMNIPAGNIELKSARYTLLTKNRFSSLADIENVIVAMRGDHAVRVKDVARVVDSFADRKSYGRLNGTPSINFNIYKKKDANTIHASEQVKERLAKLKSELPSDLEFVFTGDQARLAQRSLNLMLNSAKGGVILVIIVIFIFLGLRNALLVSLAMPISLTVTFVWLNINGYSFNNVTLFGLVLVIGILVDDAIIIIENIYRWMEQGKTRNEAAYGATHEVGPAILYSGATTIAAFAPLLMVKGISGEFMKFIPITVISAIIGAVLAAHTIMPALASRHLRLSKSAGNSTARGLGFFHRVKKVYGHGLNVLLRRPFVFPIIITVLWFGCIGLIVSGALDIRFFPSLPTEQLTYTVNTPAGTNLDETDRIVRIAENRLDDFKDELKYITANVGIGGGRTMSFDFAGSGPTYGEVRAEVKNDDIDNIHRVSSEVEAALKKIPGADVELEVLQHGPPVDEPVVIRINGDDFSTLDSLTNEVKTRLERVQGLIKVFDNYDTSRPEIVVRVDRPRAHANGLTPAQIAMAVRLAFNGIEISEFFDEKKNESVDIIAKFPASAAENPTQLLRMRILNAFGQSIPLNRVAEVNFTTGIETIQRRDGKRIAEVRADVDGISPFNGLKLAREALSDLALPAGYSLEFAGENEERDESFKSLGISLIIAVFVIYMLLVLKFNSMIQPFVIMGAIPFSMIGVVIGLIVTGNSFSMMTFLGIIALTGIAVNDSIVLVDYTNQLRAKGKTKALAIRQACLDRMRPILLTSITTIFGILPIATGLATGGKSAQALFWSPLGWAIIFGLLMSTFLILLVVPSIYMIFTWIEEEYLQGLFARRNTPANRR